MGNLLVGECNFFLSGDKRQNWVVEICDEVGCDRCYRVVDGENLAIDYL